MSETSRQALQVQYQNSANLRARGTLHARFSTSPRGWFDWVFDHFTELPDRSAILEVGCGPGGLWDPNRRRLPAGWSLFLTDLSPGMVAEARHRFQADARFRFAVVDVQALPFHATAFDAVIANHVLCHVPDLQRGLREIHGRLRPGGRIFAATNGRRHLQELDELVGRFDPQLPGWSTMREKQFTLENGAELLAPWFSGIDKFLFNDALIVPEAAPLVDYVFSMPPPRSPSPERREEFAAFVQRELRLHGPLRITKATGLFSAFRS